MKNFMVFAAGVACGALGVGYFLEKKYRESYEYEIELLDEIRNKLIKDHYKNQKEAEQAISAFSQEEKPEIDDLIKDIQKVELTMEDLENMEETEEDEIDEIIDSYVNPQDYIVDIDEEGETDIVEKKDIVNTHYNTSKESYPAPYEIDEDEFLDSDYDSQSVTYYVTNDIVVDDSYGEIMPEAFDDDVIGHDILDKIAEATNNSVFYVRNERLSMDYEIVKSDEDYNKYLFGDEEV